MSKTKKQVRVRTKKGKTYMRSMMVNSGSAEAISRRATQVSLKQDSVKPNKPGLISRLFFRNGKNQSRSALAAMNHDGPNAGSDHSWFALAVGALKDTRAPWLAAEGRRAGGDHDGLGRSGSQLHAEDRRYSGESAAYRVNSNTGTSYAAYSINRIIQRSDSADRRVDYQDLVDDLGRYGNRVPQNPNKWVR